MEKRHSMDRVFRALSDGGRERILELLLEGEKTGNMILEQMDLAQSTLSHHMKTLCESGLVLARREGKFTVYRINRRAFSAILVYCQHFLQTEDAAKGSAKEMPKGEDAEPDPVKEPSGAADRAKASAAEPERDSPQMADAGGLVKASGEDKKGKKKEKRQKEKKREKKEKTKKKKKQREKTARA